jgi:hypothetical protein
LLLTFVVKSATVQKTEVPELARMVRGLASFLFAVMLFLSFRFIVRKWFEVQPSVYIPFRLVVANVISNC